MSTTGNRLARLRTARELVSELESRLDGREEQDMQSARRNLEQAGSTIRSASYSRFIEDAMGQVAGIAIANEWDNIADRATRVLDDDIELPNEPLKTVEKTTDDRGRLSIGSEYAEHDVEIAVLKAIPTEQE